MEVKHSDKKAEEQGRYLRNAELCEEFESKYNCKIAGRYILYNGPSGSAFDVQYINSEGFLKHNAEFEIILPDMIEAYEHPSQN